MTTTQKGEVFKEESSVQCEVYKAFFQKLCVGLTALLALTFCFTSHHIIGGICDDTTQLVILTVLGVVSIIVSGFATYHLAIEPARWEKDWRFITREIFHTTGMIVFILGAIIFWFGFHVMAGIMAILIGIAITCIHAQEREVKS